MSIEVGSRLKEISRKLKMNRRQLGEKPGSNGSAIGKIKKLQVVHPGGLLRIGGFYH